MAESTAGRYVGREVRELREDYWPLMPNTRQVATAARKMLAGKDTMVLPATVQMAGSDAWISDLPHKRMAPQRTRQKLIAKLWDLKRPPASGGPRALSVATRIEQPLTAIMRDEDAGFPWEDVNDLLYIEGIAFSTVNLDMADWRKPFSLYGVDGTTVASRYAVDGAGKLRGDTGYDASTVSLDKARADMETERIDHLARHLPFRQRAWSIRSVAPMWGSDFKLDGLIIESNWSAHKLRQKGFYVGTSKDAGDAQLYPLGAIREGDSGNGSGGKQITVTEVWATDDAGLPYISYHIGGYDYVWHRDKESDTLESHVIDLSKICKDERGAWHGFSRLPISWGFGLGWSPSDMDERAMSAIAPFMQSWKNIDSIVSSLIIYSQMSAFPPLIEKMPMGVNQAGSIDDDSPETPDIQPGKITRVTGEITQIMGSGPPPAVFQVVSLLMGETKAESENGGSGGASSGIQVSLNEAFQDDALTTVHGTALKMLGQNASLVLEGATIIGECYEPIRVYQLADVLLEQKEPSDTEQMMTIDPGLVGSSYDVKALQRKTPGENPAVRQQNAALVKEGFYDRIWFLEEDGYPAPEEMANRVAWQEMLDSDAGKQATARMLESYVSNKFLAQIQEAIAGQQANQQGLPVGYADGTSPPPDMLGAGPQANGGMGGLQTPNPAAAQLGAVVGAGLQQGPTQAIVSAGGQLPVSPMQTGA